ncbi:hypothetical protein N0V88_003504 [Collariella sp. IMI 366227]|nr:hypothetical protein N0V88_003504 [Collariella sp. IMI 366227]
MLTDDVVAELLAKEATEASAKYSSMGLDAFRSTKPANKAKPNTRFLGRIIKETTNHNAALLAKEAAEAQARLDDLTEAKEKKRRKLNPTASDIRRRQLGDISSILQDRKRISKGDRHDGTGDKDQRHNKDHAPERDGRQRKSDGHKDDKEEHRSRRKHKDDSTEERRHRQRSRSPRHKERRHRDRSPLSSSDEGDRVRHSRPHKGRSGKDRDLINNESSKQKGYGRLREDDKSSSASQHGRLAQEDESDPLEDFVGPAPPSRSVVRMRGRGAIRGPAAMDCRFSEDYDPASDVQLEPAAAEDWDEAREAFRDRQKWKQQGAERLRAAGFTNEQVKKWEMGGEKDIDDVRWTKAGEKREW